MRYPTISFCKQGLFAYIRTWMAKVEAAPYYEQEGTGIQHLESILSFMKRPEYRGVIAKAAYLFCSIIDGHPFSNGNKRLAVTLIVYVLLENGYHLNAKSSIFVRRQLKRTFPKTRWKNIRSFSLPEEYFLYHLALVIADRTQKGNISFQDEQFLVRELLKKITRKIPMSLRHGD